MKGEHLPHHSGFADTVVLAATNDWDGLRMADRQLAERLADHVPVLYVDPPTSLVSRFRKDGIRGLWTKNRLTEINPRLARLKIGALPGLGRPGFSSLNSMLTSHQIRHAIADLGGTVHATIDANILVPVMGRCGEAVKLYWAQDDWVGLAPLVGSSPRAFAAAEEVACRESDLIVAANPSVARTLRTGGFRPHLIPFGCDYQLFSSATTADPAGDVHLHAPMAIFMGHLGDRIDMTILEAVVRSGIRLLLVGPVHPRSDPHRFERLAGRPNVQWVGEKPFEQLPHYLAHAEVGLVPYTHSRFNIGSFPLKILEYLAAGLSVVSTDLPAVKWLDSDQITVRNAPEAFVDAVQDLLADPERSTAATLCQAFASAHSWSQRAEQFLDVLDRRSA